MELRQAKNAINDRKQAAIEDKIEAAKRRK